MTIIRSCEIMSVSKVLSVKVRRKHVQWRDLMLDLNNPEMEADYWKFKQDHKKMSANRVAYNILKRYYSTTTIAGMRYDYGV